MNLSDWTPVCAQAELPPGTYKVVEVDDADIAVFNIDGQYYAIEDVCTHDGAPLTGGGIEGCEVICPRHGARFCLKTGDALTPPAYEPVSVFPVRLHHDMLYTRDDRWD